jgi:hypothetical protein
MFSRSRQALAIVTLAFGLSSAADEPPPAAPPIPLEDPVFSPTKRARNDALLKEIGEISRSLTDALYTTNDRYLVRRETKRFEEALALLLLQPDAATFAKNLSTQTGSKQVICELRNFVDQIRAQKSKELLKPRTRRSLEIISKSCLDKI